MVAYNYQREFVEDLLAGRKTSTLRMRGKKRHARPGEMVDHWHGLRTKQACKLGTAMCETAEPCTLAVYGASFFQLTYIERIDDGRSPDRRYPAMPAIALMEAFPNVYQMREWFLLRYGEGEHAMIQVTWDPDKGHFIDLEDFENGRGLNTQA